MLSALEGSLPALSLSNLPKLTKNGRLVVLSLGGDQCSANTRLKLAVAEAFVKHNEVAVKRNAQAVRGTGDGL
eukprot:8924058-Lingulodinium_polyedra.AAC.1